MADQESLNLVHRFVEICNSKQFNDLDELLSADYVHHDPNLPPELQRGLPAYKQAITMMFGAFPDLIGSVEDVVSDGDKVVTRLRWQGTHLGDLMGIPASGNRVDFSMIEIQRVAGGKIVEGWAQFDAMGMMQQIGAMPSPQQASA
ncbi:MAG: ester cyclase [Nitrolancea sp.]